MSASCQSLPGPCAGVSLELRRVGAGGGEVGFELAPLALAAGFPRGVEHALQEAVVAGAALLLARLLQEAEVAAALVERPAGLHDAQRVGDRELANRRHRFRHRRDHATVLFAVDVAAGRDLGPRRHRRRPQRFELRDRLFDEARGLQVREQFGEVLVLPFIALREQRQQARSERSALFGARGALAQQGKRMHAQPADAVEGLQRGERQLAECVEDRLQIGWAALAREREQALHRELRLGGIDGECLFPPAWRLADARARRGLRGPGRLRCPRGTADAC